MYMIGKDFLWFLCLMPDYQIMLHRSIQLIVFSDAGLECIIGDLGCHWQSGNLLMQGYISNVLVINSITEWHYPAQLI